MNIEYTVSDSGFTMTTTELDSVMNSISTIAGTPYATAPYLRSMGIKNYPPESNSEIARNRYAAEIITQCSKWEDRIKVAEVCFVNNNDVKVVIRNG